jgi:transcriptional regulator with XRE-family HTH domain
VGKGDGKAGFDTQRFFAALDGQRQSKRLTWKQVADQAAISASTLTRMSQGRRPDVDGLAALAAWSGLDADEFFAKSERGTPEMLAIISTHLRADAHLDEQGAAALDEIVKAAYEALRNDR